jgi:plastocyanin
VADPLTISLTQSGKKVTHLKAGAYVIVVQDTASDHDFHLTGPGVDKTTTVGGKGVYRWNVKLTKGTYTYVCDPHSSFMKGSFTVS